MGTLQPHRGFLPEQRPRGQDARQTERDAAGVPSGSGEIQRSSIGQLNESTRGHSTAEQTVFTYSGVFAGIPTGNAPSIIGRSFTITAEVEVAQGGGNGMLVTEGG